MSTRITTLEWVPELARGFVRDLRARWACEEEGLPYDLELVDFPTAKSQDYRRSRQPFGQVPAYADDVVELFESGAIAFRIAERGTVLLPADPAGRARALQWVIAALSSIETWILQLQMVEIFEKDEPWSALRRPKVLADLETRLGELSHRLDGKAWLEGKTFTVGDLMMVSVLGGLKHFEVLDRYPVLAGYLARGEARPAHVKAMADQLALYASAKAPASWPTTK